MQIRLLESAKEDLREGWRFYEKHAAGLGICFLDRVQADVNALVGYAGIHELSGGFHRMLVTRFPFAVYYLIESGQIDVYAILDCRRDTRLSSRSRLDRQTTRLFAKALIRGYIPWGWAAKATF